MSATSELVAKDEAVASEQAAESQALKDECEADLAEAIPALEAALSALDTLKVRFNSLIYWSTIQTKNHPVPRSLHICVPYYILELF